jgi:energy-coupling factor transport system ATP-binding protein
LLENLEIQHSFLLLIMENKVSIQVENLSVWVRKDRPMLSDVSFEIKDGEFVLVLGSSGSGKSVLASCMNGLIPQVIPTYYSGKITINGRNPQDTQVSEMATDVGLVFQDPDAQLVALYVEDEIVFGPENLMLQRDEIGKRLRDSLETVGMWDFKDVHTWDLSGGQKQRVAIGSVLSMQPKILVLDEPTSNLDPAGTRGVFELLPRLRKESNLTIIAIEHKVDELIEQVDRLLVFDEGRLIANGHPREVIAKHGDELMRKGINLPQISEMALVARSKGLAIPDDKFPLTYKDIAGLFPIPSEITPVRRSVIQEKITAAPQVHFDNVSFSYPYRAPALRNITLDIYKGEFLAIVGQNGAGKTTLTKLLVGLIKATEGKILFDGEDISKISLERLTEKVGYVFQYPDNQLVTDTVFDEVAFSMRVRGYPEDQVKTKVDEVLSTMELNNLIERHPLTLSMGEKRRLSVATMLVLDQDILILDEPTMGMDWGHVVSIMEICRKLQAQGRTIIMVTHDMRVVSNWADRVIAMTDGQVLLDSAPQTFFVDRAALEKTHLSQLPVCKWRNCQVGSQARCTSCVEDILKYLLDPASQNKQEVLQ